MEASAGYGRTHLCLPPGFRFHPTDEELVRYYLARKVHRSILTDPVIVEIDLNKCEPWDLPAIAKMGEKEWYFYSLLDRKYPTGLRTNRATDGGYWKATGKDREVVSSLTSALVGMKKTLVFYKGRAPKGVKTNWVMHEYRLDGNAKTTCKEDSHWVMCRVFQKKVKIPFESSWLSPLVLESPYEQQYERESIQHFRPFMNSAYCNHNSLHSESPFPTKSSSFSPEKLYTTHRELLDMLPCLPSFLPSTALEKRGKLQPECQLQYQSQLSISQEQQKSHEGIWSRFAQEEISEVHPSDPHSSIDLENIWTY